MSLEKYIEKIEDFTNKKILITGCTSGIGLEAARILARKNADIVMLVRNKSKADSLREELTKINSNINIDFISYDQCDYDSIDKAVKEINEKHSDFYALVANAGVFHHSHTDLSKQNHPITIETNFLGLWHFLDQIIDTCHHKKIIIQGSLVAKMHIKKNVDIYNPKFTALKQYMISKSCAESLWYSYAMNNKDNEFILVEPGMTSTDIIRELKQPIRFLGHVFMRTISHSAKKASLTILKGLEEQSHNLDFYVPRHFFTMRGYPKKVKFPKRRIREYLLHK